MPGDHTERVDGDDSSTLRSAMGRFALLSMLALVGLALAIAWESSQYADDEAVHDAREQTRRMARLLAAPLVTAGARNGNDQVAAAEMERQLRSRVRDASVAHIVLWDPSGRVIWADDPTIGGRAYILPTRVERLFGTHRSLAYRDREDHDLPGSQHEADLVEVYVGATGADGEPFVLEAYLPPGRVGVARQSVFWKVLPIGLGGLVLFQLVVLPLAFSLARRVDRGRSQRMDLVARSMSSWHAERRQLAQDLHDGVIQDLAAASYTVPAIAAALPEGEAGDQARTRAQQVGTALTHSLDALRSLALDLFPADLGGEGLVPALRDLTARAAASGLGTTLDVDDDLDLSPGAAGLVFRVTREALRNVERHARAGQVSVRVVREGANVLTEVADDGVGVRHRSRDGQPDGRARHFGLQLLRAMLRDVDGSLAVSERYGGGTVLQARLPADLPG